MVSTVLHAIADAASSLAGTGAPPFLGGFAAGVALDGLRRCVAG